MLIVDDSIVNRKLISLVLRGAGAEYDGAENGQQACDMVIGKDDWDVILLDMQMPVMDGYTAASRMREAGVTIPIIALTAHAMKGDRERCIEAGCTDFQTKPIDSDLLLKALCEIRGTEQLENHQSNTPPRDTTPVRSTLPVEDPDFADIAREFAVRVKQDALLLKAAVDERNASETMRLAHRVKGSGGGAGFAVFTVPSSHLYDAAREARWNDAMDHVLTLIDLAERTESPAIVVETSQESPLFSSIRST